MFLYLDCFAGVSGDMFLGAMIDLGLPLAHLTEELDKLGLSSKFRLEAREVSRRGLRGIKADVILTEREHAHRHLKDIEEILNNSKLELAVKEGALAVFRRLALAESKAHGTTPDKIHFHEVGAIDAIADITGSAIAVDYFKTRFNLKRIVSSPIEVGGGFVKCAHGLLPVPAPAVAELLTGIPQRRGLADSETATPTGAAIVAQNALEFTEKITFTPVKCGYGFGTKEFDFPNALRVYLAEELAPKEAQYLLETNIDDMNPESYPYIEEKLFAAGALDVFKTPIIMKKGRPAVLLSALVTEGVCEKVREVIFRETSSFGLRKIQVEKEALERKIERVKTRFGEISVKFAYIEGAILKYKAEYEDCRKAALEHRITLAEVYREVDKAVYD